MLLFWLLCTRPAAALLCGSFLSPMTVSATALSFGTYVSGSALSANTTVTIRCTIPLDVLPDFRVQLSTGNASSADARFLMLGGGKLFHYVYADAGFASVWGDGASGSVERV